MRGVVALRQVAQLHGEGGHVDLAHLEQAGLDRGARAVVQLRELGGRFARIEPCGETFLFLRGPAHECVGRHFARPPLRVLSVACDRLAFEHAHRFEQCTHGVRLLIWAVRTEDFAGRRMHAVRKCIEYLQGLFALHGFLPLLLFVELVLREHRENNVDADASVDSILDVKRQRSRNAANQTDIPITNHQSRITGLLPPHAAGHELELEEPAFERSVVERRAARGGESDELRKPQIRSEYVR